MNFIVWVRSNDHDFFMNAPPATGVIRTAERIAYERRLLAFSRAWRSGPVEVDTALGKEQLPLWR